MIDVMFLMSFVFLLQRLLFTIDITIKIKQFGQGTKDYQIPTTSTDQNKITDFNWHFYLSSQPLKPVVRNRIRNDIMP